AWSVRAPAWRLSRSTRRDERPRSSYLWAAGLADLHRRAGNTALAKQHRVIALASAPSAAVRAALERRLQSA
ncbi:MAG TPA: hypothetical protein VM580_05775, partial [Labilithrix sp.]|nr:hypothetical protein [Labilithrix sp.]